MKKITLFMFIVFATFTLQAQNKLLSSLDEYYNGTSWEIGSGTNYEYDNSNNLITATRYNYDSSTSSWTIISSKNNYVYNASNKVTVEFDQFIKGGEVLENDYKATYSYTNGKCTEELGEGWDSESASWRNSYKAVYTYNSNNLIDGGVTYDWADSQWKPEIRFSVTYNSNNKISSVFRQIWVNSQWVNNYKSLYTYNANNKLITYRGGDWDDFNSTYKESDRSDYAWDATGNMTSDASSYTSNNETYKYKNEYSYDSFSLISTFAHPFKDKTGIDYIDTGFPYVNKINVENYFDYNTETSSYRNSSRTTYNYNTSITLSNDKFETANATITVFPNPAKDFLSIKTSLNTAIDKVIITDISGKIVVQQHQNTTQVNVQNLSRGMYFLQVFTGDKKLLRKFLKE